MTIHPHFYSPRPLDENDLKRVAPSIFTNAAHASRSDRFRPIPTIEAVRALAEEGYVCFGASEARSFTPHRRPYTRHMLKFRPRDHGVGPRLLNVGDTTFETILVNANDGSRGYHLDAGLFKLACLNGMVIKSDDYGSLTIRHTGEDTVARVIAGTHEIAKGASKALEAPDKWSKIILDAAQRGRLAEDARLLRFGDKEDRITSQQLLIPRRIADTGHDLWSVFNVIQENVISGGLSSARREGSRLWTTRAVRGIDDNVRLNKQLWQLAEKVAEEAA